MRYRLWIRGLIILGIVLFMPLESFGTTVDDISKEIMCQCGCSMVLSSCQCGTADSMRSVIKSKIESGWQRPQIINYFVKQYGEKVLSAPTKKGFNLTAWITPFVALLLGGGIICAVIILWNRRGEEAEQKEKKELSSDKTLDKYQNRFEEELSDFD